MAKKLSAATLNKYSTELVNLYVQLYADKYGKSPEINRFKQKWGFTSMIEDMGKDQAVKVIDYYFQTGRIGHPIDYLLYNYEKLQKIMVEIEKDEQVRKQLLIDTERKVREVYGDN